MRRIKLNIDKLHRANLAEVSRTLHPPGGCFPLRSMAQQPGQRTFSSAEEASSALVAAVQSDDEKAMLGLLGPDGKEIISSGDEAEDARGRANFVAKYREMHRLVNEPDGTTTLYIGAKNWPTPIPLVNKGNSWYFDTEAGKKEILYRRIGRNELSAIRVCQELVAAENEYHRTQHDEYAKRITSDDGRHNGLYWKAAAGEPQSPIGPLVASAVAEGYANGISALTPYRGYYFHILSRQGKTCPGRSEELHRGRQDDRRICVRGFSGAIPVVGRNDLYRRQRWSRVREGSRKGQQRSRRTHEGIRSGCHLAQG